MEIRLVFVDYMFLCELNEATTPSPEELMMAYESQVQDDPCLTIDEFLMTEVNDHDYSD